MIDPRAEVSPEAVLEDGVEVGPFSLIGPQVHIGARTRVGAHTIIEGPARIGPDNTVHHFVALGGPPQDKKYRDEPTELEIGTGNTIREFCTINRGTPDGGGVTRIGDDNWIMAYVHIAHDCQVGNHTVLANAVTLAGHVEVQDHATLAGFTKVHQFCRVGAHSFCGMDAGLNRDVPPYVTAAGHLAEPRGINAEGLRRRNFSAAQIRNIREAYRTLYRSDLRLEEALEKMESAAADQPELRPLVEFIRASARGIIR